MHVPHEAKKRLPLNLVTNFASTVVVSVVGLWLTPYLIDNLGVELYGLVPLLGAVTKYFQPVTMAISATVGRFVMLYAGKEDADRTNTYFSTAFFALLALCAVLLIPTAAITLSLPSLFQLPAGHEGEAKALFLLIMLSTLTYALASPFSASLLVKHRFELRNLVNVAGWLLRVAIIVVCFRFVAVSITYVGVAIIAMALLSFTSAMYFKRRFTPEWRLKASAVRLPALRQMASMGSWLVVAQAGALLYLSIDLVIINVMLGPTEGGRYAPITQWVALLSLLGSTLSRVFTPIAIEYAAKGDNEGLTRQVGRSVKFMGLAMALPIGLLCGLSRPLLRWWIGEEFMRLAPLAWLLIGPGIINIVARPFFSLNTALNRVATPSIATIIGGCTNLIGSILLVRYTGLGIYGVAVATMVSLTAKNAIFTPIYGAMILKRRKDEFFRSFLPGVIACAIIALSGLAASSAYELSSFLRLLCAGAAATIVYVPACYFLAMNKDDRRFLRSVLRASLGKL